MGIAITLVVVMILWALVSKRQSEKYLEEMEELIKNILNREENPHIRDEIKDDYEELIKNIKDQEEALNESIKEVNIYQRELNLAYKSVLAKQLNWNIQILYLKRE